MRTLYLDCGMGAAGDMLTAALFELLDEKDRAEFITQMNGLGIPGVRIEPESASKCGIMGTHMKVTVNGEEEESHDHHHDHNHEHSHEHHHEHHHDHDHNHEHSHDHHHDHNHSHNHHDHDHSHEHSHDHNHDHEHDHGHNHTHEHHHHHHSGMADIENVINSLPVSDQVKENASKVYGLIAEAESHAHGVPVTEIHFHEVGTMDAVADVTAVCLLMEKLGVDKVIASEVHVGSGHVHCAHGILQVPAPATAYILKDVPIYGGSIKGELCTPTGAALLKHFVTEFGAMPPMKVQKIGYGMGKKDFAMANCVRALLGETVGNGNQVVELTCNVDDMTAERIGFAMEQIFEAGALEVYTVPVGMKKSRPGMMICVMCREEKREAVLSAVFKHTTTLGIRENISRRYTLTRRLESIDTEFGKVQVKCSEGYGVKREKLEYEDLADIARKNGLSIDEVVKIIEANRK